MSVVIRLSRQGHKHHPFYRISVADSRRASTGKFLQQIGYYDPNQNPPTVKIDEISALKWMKTGALPSDTVKALFKKQGIMEKLSQVKKGTSPEETKAANREWKPKKVKLHKKVKAAAAEEAKAVSAAAATEAAASATEPAAA